MTLHTGVLSRLRDSIFEIKAYFRHLLHARGPHGVHSPLVYFIITEILPGRKKQSWYTQIESRRKELIRDGNLVEVKDYGAGSRTGNGLKRTIGAVARHALQPRRSAQMLSRLVGHFKPHCIIELGSSLGITTAYLAKSMPDGVVRSIEGSPGIAALAVKNLDALGVTNAQIIVGTFEEKLAEVLSEAAQVDFVLIDGNHRYEPTIRYFELLLQHSHQGTIIILDDIHWSEEMQNAWDEIRAHQNVTLSLDFFDFGVLFFLHNRAKEHFILHRP